MELFIRGIVKRYIHRMIDKEFMKNSLKSSLGQNRYFICAWRMNVSIEWIVLIYRHACPVYAATTEWFPVLK